MDLELAAYDGSETDANSNVLIEPRGMVFPLFAPLVAILNSNGYKTEVYNYDWRKSFDYQSISAELTENILNEYDQPVHLITHSEGGTVARRALQQLVAQVHEDPAKEIIGKVILMAPASFGAFVTALSIAGSFSDIPMADMFMPPPPPVQAVMASFTAFYQLLPWDPTRVPSLCRPVNDIRRPAFWEYNVPIDLVRLALAFPPGGTPWGETINTDCFRDHISVIVGTHPSRTTPGGVVMQDGGLAIDHEFDFPPSQADGWVPHVLSVLPGSPAYCAGPTGHIMMPMFDRVIRGVCALLAGQIPDPSDLPPCP